jgi:hypothetical protein
VRAGVGAGGELSAGEGGETSAGDAGRGGEESQSTPTAGRGGEGTAEVCDVIELKSSITPNHAVVMLDKSESMGRQVDNGSSWEPLRQGLGDFFTSGWRSGTTFASLSYFPTPGGLPEACSSEYTTPSVALTDLSAPEALLGVLNTLQPSGGSPMLSAVYGATTYAKTLMVDNPGSRTVLFLITDGEPAMSVNEDGTTGDPNGTGTQSSRTDCVPSALEGTGVANVVEDVAGVLAGAATNDPRVPTYVVGVGSNQAALELLANAGGTELIVPDTTDPTAAAASIRSALEGAFAYYGERTYECGVDIVPPESGEMPDPEVTLVYPDGSVDRCPRSDDCAIAGWHYDDLESPTKVMFCPQTCTELQIAREVTLRVVVYCTQ